MIYVQRVIVQFAQLIRQNFLISTSSKKCLSTRQSKDIARLDKHTTITFNFHTTLKRCRRQLPNDTSRIYVYLTLAMQKTHVNKGVCFVFVLTRIRNIVR